MEPTPDQLKEKALLLLQRERELFELRMKRQQDALWLKLAQALPQVFRDPRQPINEGYALIRKALIDALRWQRVSFLELGPRSLTPVVPTGPPRALPPECLAVLQSAAYGVCNDAGDAAGAALAEAIGLARFIWSRIDVPGRASVVVVGGFDRAKAKFQAPFELSLAAQLGNTSQQIQTLIGNVLLVHELELERDRLQHINQTLERRDRELHALTDQLRAANDTLEQRVRTRTQELGRRNHDMRSVLDNVVQGLLTIDTDGRLAQERSAKIDEWFGPYEGNPSFVDYIAEIDAAFAETFDVGYEVLNEGVLPLDMCLSQLPTRFSADRRIFHCGYRLLADATGRSGLLIMIDDVTEKVRMTQEEAMQSELLAAFQRLMNDRNGFLAFFEEADRLVAELVGGGLDATTRSRHLHTLKSNAGIMGLAVVAELCHRAEDELTIPGAPGLEGIIQRLGERWRANKQTLEVVVGNRAEGIVEISGRSFEQLCQEIRAGASPDQILRRLNFLAFEPLDLPLGRLAQHALALAKRMGKGALSMSIEACNARADPRRFGGLWAALLHVVRNAIDHGIEGPEERLARGKSEHGHLWLRASHDDRELTLEIEDDGRGIDWARIRQLAAARNLPHQSANDLLRALASDGFTTKSNLTMLSGRGVGMSAVYGQVLELGGTLSVNSELGAGCCWRMVLPLASPTGGIQAIAPSERPAASS